MMSNSSQTSARLEAGEGKAELKFKKIKIIKTFLLLVCFASSTPYRMQLADTIKSIIEGRLCPIHDIHPVIDISENQLQIICCCIDFHKECKNEAEVALGQFDPPHNLDII